MSGRDLSITHGPAVTPFHSLMIQSMHTGSGPCAHMYRGAVVLCETIICARFFPPDEGGAHHNLHEQFIPP